MVTGRIEGEGKDRRVIMEMTYDEAELVTHALEDHSMDLTTKVLDIQDGKITVHDPDEWAANLDELARTYWNLSCEMDKFIYPEYHGDDNDADSV
jgi:hypothetical protein